jgi:peptidoglycan/LPS O-acetylase OafA/YrhL
MAVAVLCYVAVPLAVYLTLTRTLTLRAFIIGLGIGTSGHIIIFFSTFPSLQFFYPLYRVRDMFLGYFMAHASAAHWSVQVSSQWCLLFPPLLAAIGATKLKRSVLRRLPGTVATTFKNVMLGNNYE